MESFKRFVTLNPNTTIIGWNHLVSLLTTVSQPEELLFQVFLEKTTTFLRTFKPGDTTATFDS